ncbi:MAG: hypothetical protein CR975_00150 [Gammaproteobacteria bacterium]|nr:MAG: hypothetical protein CR975_00150 [Gammaproteobacteria bacterium]
MNDKTSKAHLLGHSKDRESLLNFPEKFPIKIFGLDNDDYRQSVEKIIESHVTPAHRLHWHENISSKGNYLAITVTIMAQSQIQLDSIYLDLTNNPHVKMAL